MTHKSSHQGKPWPAPASVKPTPTRSSRRPADTARTSWRCGDPDANRAGRLPRPTRQPAQADRIPAPLPHPRRQRRDPTPNSPICALQESGAAGPEPRRSAAVCAFSVTSRVTQRDGVAGRGHAREPHLAAPRRPGTHWRAPPRRSGGPDRLPKPGSLDDARLAPFRLPRITPGLQASGRQPAIQETSWVLAASGRPGRGSPALGLP
jgi:hypothetical protein